GLRCAQNTGQKQHGSKVHDGWRGKGLAGSRAIPSQRQVGNQGHDDELQANQSARGATDRHIKVFPSGERSHVSSFSSSTLRIAPIVFQFRIAPGVLMSLSSSPKQRMVFISRR